MELPEGRFVRVHASILNIFIWLAYYSGLDALFYWLNRKAKRILVFHNVLPDEMCRPGHVNETVMRLSDFKKVMGWLRQFRFSVDCLDPKTLTLTFDDGYRNQYSVAFKTLRQMGVPMICFKAGDVGKVLVIDKLLLWITEAPIDFVPGGDRDRYWREHIYPRYWDDVDALGENVVRELDGLYAFEKIWRTLPPDYVRERFGAFSADEQREMEAAGSIVAWHTRAHYPLSRLTGARLRDEMMPPDSGQLRQCFSYPFGGDKEVSDEAIALAHEIGYPCAVSNVAFSMTADRNQTLFYMPRIGIQLSKPWLHYALSGLRHFLVCKRLLPKVEELNGLK